MKKTLLAIVLVCLLSVTVAGVAFAIDPHQSASGNKLIGTGQCGTLIIPEPSGTNLVMIRSPRFEITNTDCQNSIRLEQLSILDASGSVLYEGPFYQAYPTAEGLTVDHNNVERIPVTTLEPHQQASVVLMYWFPDGEGGYLPYGTALNTLCGYYTVEIFWTAAKTTSSPLGTVTTEEVRMFWDSGSLVDREQSSNRSQMVCVATAGTSAPTRPAK